MGQQQHEQHKSDDDDNDDISQQHDEFRSLYVPQNHEVLDDDDISQHEYTIKDDSTLGNDDDSSSTPYHVGDKSKKGYWCIEDWHADHIAENPVGAQVLANLKCENARWAKTFNVDESSLGSGGEGIWI